jgi:hypothetical protein
MSFTNIPITSGKKTRGSGYNLTMTSKSGFTSTADTELHVHKVSEAKEFEAFRYIPKYTKPYMAVINPASPKKKPQPKKLEPEFEVEGSPSRIAIKRSNKKEIPEHLLKPPMETASARAAPRRATSSQKGAKGYKNKLEQQKLEFERKRLTTAEKNILSWLIDIKKCLDKDEQASFCESLPKTTVKVAKEKMLTKKLIRFLFDEVMTQQFVDRNNSPLINKSEFIKFVQAFRRDILEGEISDMFLALLKKLAVSQQAETASKDLKKGNAHN